MTEKNYSLRQIVRLGLIINPLTGVPFKRHESIRRLLVQFGFYPEPTVFRNQPMFQIKESDVEKINKRLSELEYKKFR